MLKSLYIENVILIKKIFISLQGGMCSITGDSGAGKSVILDSIGIILGDRASQSVIRTGANQAVIIAEFDISKNQSIIDTMVESGYATSGELLIKKVINKDSTSKIFINDTPSTINFIKNITSDLIEIHGQTDQLFLLKSSGHVKILDRYSKLESHLTGLKNAFQEYKAVEIEYTKTSQNLAEKEKNLSELLEMQEELTSYNIKPNEENTLLESRGIFLQSKKIIDLFEKLSEKIKLCNIGEIAVLAIKIQSSGEKLPDEISEKLDNVIKITENMTDELNEVKDGVYSAESSLNRSFRVFDLEKIEERIDLIREIARKYRVPSLSLFDFIAEIDEKIKHIETLQANQKNMQEKLNEKLEKYHKIADVISEIRKKNALTMSQNVNNILHRLHMQNADFRVEITKNSQKISEIGSDEVSFNARLNAGMPYFPIEKIASGGEISRLMLAFKSVISQNLLDSGVIIFDEIEAGLSGNIAKKVATELLNMSKTTQVIAITHNCHIAGFANSQIKVSKYEDNGEVFTNIQELNPEERIDEIAKIISPESSEESTKIAMDIVNNRA